VRDARSFPGGLLCPAEKGAVRARPPIPTISAVSCSPASEENEGRYGIDRIHRELARRGHAHSPRRVRRLARAAGLACVHPRPYKATTVQDKARQRGLVDLAGRQFVPEGADQLWYGDITYISHDQRLGIWPG